jgi:hypothetical protein
MDSEHWISRLAAAKRFYAAQLGHAGTRAPSPRDRSDSIPSSVLWICSLVFLPAVG